MGEVGNGKGEGGEVVGGVGACMWEGGCVKREVWAGEVGCGGVVGGDRVYEE